MILTQAEICSSSPPLPPPAPGFEGPEKKLEVRFKQRLLTTIHDADDDPTAAVDVDDVGLRAVSQARWQEVLDTVKCTIISSAKNDHFDSFVLSESSLFVYPYKVILKTCGTTTLLHCVSSLQVLAKEYHTEVEMILFSRKNLNFPSWQKYPHNNFEDEVHFLNKLFHGHGFVLGPVDQDSWHLYVADYRDAAAVATSTSQVFEVMMHDLDPMVMGQFYKKENVSARATTLSSGIAKLMPGSLIDDYQFEPCGYSMNGLLKKWYWTIHITPEPHCSYVSFETNAPLNSYARLLRKVLDTFRPRRATVALLADDGAPCCDVVNSFQARGHGRGGGAQPAAAGFRVRSHAVHDVPSSALSVMTCNLELGDCDN